jgi:magnesium chelatase family protein
MLARHLITMLPSMMLVDTLETSRIPRVAGLTSGRPVVVTTRRFRVPPHTSFDVSVIGGGPRPMPGEVSLAHHGVLCLDERQECRPHVLEGLRQPLEEGASRNDRASCLNVKTFMELALRVMTAKHAHSVR